MTELTVLACPAAAGWLERICCSLRGLGRCRLIAAFTAEEASEFLECAAPRLLIVNADPGAIDEEGLDLLLWTNSTLARPAAVVATAQAYDPERALALFRLGVDDYLAGDEHLSRLPGILRQLLDLEPDSHVPAQILPVADGVRPLRPVTLAPLRWVTAEPA